MYISIKFTCDNEGHEEQAYWSLNSIFSKAISRCKMAMRYNLTLFNITARTKKAGGQATFDVNVHVLLVNLCNFRQISMV